MLRLVTFDVTGTLLRPLPSAGEQYAIAIKNHASLVCDVSSMEKSFKESYTLYKSTYPFYGRTVGVTCRSWWLSVFLDTVLKSGIATGSRHEISKINFHKHLPLLSIDEKSLLHVAFNAVYDDFKWAPLPYSLQLLRFLKELSPDISIGILTNADDRVKDGLQNAGLHENIDFVITSCESGFEKPDSRIFKLALETASNLPHQRREVTASQTLHIGDNLEKDYVGATKVGMLSLLLDPDDNYVKSGLLNPNHCIKHLGCAQQYVMANSQ